MITVTIAIVILMILGLVVCMLPVLALPLLDVAVAGFVIWRLVRLIKKLGKKKDGA